MADLATTIGQPDPSGLTKPGELHFEVHPQTAANPNAPQMDAPPLPVEKPAVPAAKTTPKESPAPSADSDKDKSWTEIEIDPRYRALPVDARLKFREKYFDDVVVPRFKKAQQGRDVSPEELTGLKKQFTDITRESPLKFDDYNKFAETGDAGYLPGIDYGSGVPLTIMTDFVGADNDRERFLSLAKHYGKTNVGIDPGGRWYVRLNNGKRVAVMGYDTFWKPLAAEFANNAPEFLGMGIGSMLAPESIPFKMVTQSATRMAKLEKLAQLTLNKLGLGEKAFQAGGTGYSMPTVIPWLGRQIDKGMIQVGRLADVAIRSNLKAAPAAAGAMVAKTLQEGAKGEQGTFDKSAIDTAKAIGEQGYAALLGENVFQGARTIGDKFILDLYARSASPTEKELAVRSFAKGFYPSVFQARGQTGGGPIWGRVQNLADQMFGFARKREGKNWQALNQELDAYLDKIGVTDPQEMHAFKQRILSKDFAVAEAMGTTGKEFEDARANIQKVTEDAVNKEQSDLEQRTNDLMKEAASVSHPMLAADLEKNITQARSKLGKLANVRYSEIWNANGEPVVAPTTPLKEEAKSLWEEIAKITQDQEKQTPKRKWVPSPIGRGGRWETITAPAEAPDELAGKPVITGLDKFKAQLRRILDMDDMVPLQDLARLRTDFYSAAEDKTLTPDIESSRFRRLAESISNLMEEMESDPGISGEAARKLRATNEWYGNEIAKFEAANVVRLARPGGTQGAAKVEDIPASIIDPRHPSLMMQVEGVVGGPMVRKIAAKKFDQLRDSAIDPVTGKFDAKLLAKNLAPYVQNGFARKAWGLEIGKEVEALQKEASALGGFIDPETLTPGTIRESLRKAVVAKQLADRYWSEHLLSNLASGGKAQEDALTRVASMKSLSDIRLMKSYMDTTYGKNSPQFQKVRQMAMQFILRDAVSISDSPYATPLTGRGLAVTLSGIGRDKLDEMFGHEMTEDLFHLGDIIKYVTARPGNMMAGALRAGTLMFHPLAHLPALAESYLTGQLVMMPGFLRWVTIGLEGDGNAVRMVRAMTRTAAYTFGETWEKHIKTSLFPPPPEWNQASGQ